jgi:hypothetical protein
MAKKKTMIWHPRVKDPDPQNVNDQLDSLDNFFVAFGWVHDDVQQIGLLYAKLFKEGESDPYMTKRQLHLELHWKFVFENVDDGVGYTLEVGETVLGEDVPIDHATDLKVKKKPKKRLKKGDPGYGQVNITYPLAGATVPVNNFCPYGTDPNNLVPTGTMALAPNSYPSAPVTATLPNWSLQFPNNNPTTTMTAGNGYTLTVQDTTAGSQNQVINLKVQSVG